MARVSFIKKSLFLKVQMHKEKRGLQCQQNFKLIFTKKKITAFKMQIL